MHQQKLVNLQHSHEFIAVNRKGERRTLFVLVLTFLTMLLEVAAGTVFGSMALLADGWHMATHVAAFMITLYAYRYSRIHAYDGTFAFSAAKVGVLGGFASSIALGVVALMMVAESGERLFFPRAIDFNDAIYVACFGLAINLISALVLRDGHDHGHAHDHTHDHHHHHDHNLKAAYLHVMADALTSILAITALLLGKFYGWVWLDAAMGLVGAILIGRWSYGLIKETSPVLLDESIDVDYKTAIKQKLESDCDNRVADLHVWRLGPSDFAVIASVVSHTPKAPEHYKALLKGFPKLSHVTVEVNQCSGEGCV
ncbi:MAG: cation transporter [Methylobacter sp.]|nr:MAG: cation transporter [Methylobacter sp.]PPD37554.1 MAG: cation transporter [Methylomonas sp.]